MTEFELIARYFDRRPVDRPALRAGIGLGIGDDCALVSPGPGRTLAVSTDMLVAGRHFFADVDPASLGWKTLAVNLSDLAAIGARPVAFTLALALPDADERWLAAFASGLFACADAFDCPLVGGDTTRGPLNLCVTVFGDVVERQALRRDRAEDGDDVWVSGSLGRAGLALQRLQDGDAVSRSLRDALERPTPRVALGAALVDVAHAAIDVSDGLAQDLGHVLAASGVGASIDVAALPVGAELAELPPDVRERLALSAGDDYELCFTAPVDARDAVAAAATAARTTVTRIGAIRARPGLVLDRAAVDASALAGFDHFG